MPREGYAGITLDNRMMNELDTIADKEMCASRAEVIRLLVRNWRKENQNFNKTTSKASSSVRRYFNGLTSENFLNQLDCLVYT